MHHLRVPTTRALSVIGVEKFYYFLFQFLLRLLSSFSSYSFFSFFFLSQLIKTGEKIGRAWYAANSTKNPYVLSPDEESRENLRKFAPDTMIRETGAIVCRVSKTFLRFAHLELFAMRKEWEELVTLMDYTILREFPFLIEQFPTQGSVELDSDWKTNGLPAVLPPGDPKRYTEMYRTITDRAASLVSEWIRVGYVQGNMNSDNTLIGGRTVDYGPYGWMEEFHPNYQPFTSDPVGRFSFLNQPEAMGINIAVLGQTVFIPFLKHIQPQLAYTKELQDQLNEISTIMEEEYSDRFEKYYQEMYCIKLGITTPEKADRELWSNVLKLLHRFDFLFLFLLKFVSFSFHSLFTVVDIIVITLFSSENYPKSRSPLMPPQTV
jgi:uncharacterized protein YdiU (UPF0061 family)